MRCLSKIAVLILLLSAVTNAPAAFIGTPTSVNATLGSTANFTCSVSTGLLFWLINGSTLPKLNNMDITANTTSSKSTLYILAKEQYNNTNVSCSLAIHGVGFLDSDPVVLQVQGLLAAVGSLEAYSLQTFILLTWIPPFSLDLTGIDPDVFYYVEVYNISTGGKTLFINSYKVSESRFNFTLPSPSPCDQFELRVIPSNGAGNGSVAHVNGTFPEKQVYVNATIEVDVLSETKMDVEISLSQTLDICKSQLVATNQKTGEVSETLSPKHEGSGLSVNVTNGTDGILFNYHYSITLELMNSAGIVYINGSLSLFDVQEFTANTFSFLGTVNTSCIFAQNSQALGCLVILHPQTKTQTEMFAYAARDNSTDLTASISIPGVSNGSHTVLVFDGEQNGLLSARAAAVQNVTVTQGGPEPAMNMDSGARASIRKADSKICVTCSDMNDGESNGCVVVVHSTQNLESTTSHEIPKSGERCFPQEDGEYTVAVFRQSMSNVLQENPLNVSVVSIYDPTPTTYLYHTDTASPILSVTSPATPVDLVPVTVGAIVAGLMTAAALVIIIIAAMIYIRRRSYVTFDIESEKLRLQSYHHAKKGENKPLMVAPDCGDTEQTSGPIYADVNAVTGKIKPPTRDDRVQYSNILPLATVTAPRVEPTSPPLPAKSHTSNTQMARQQSSINLDILFSELYSVIPKWKQLAEVIGIDEDLVDEIFTNNERDEECLRAVLEVWMKKSPTWRTVTDSVRRIGEDQLAESLYLKCVLPLMVQSQSKTLVVEPSPRDPTLVQHISGQEEDTHIMDAGDSSQNGALLEHPADVQRPHETPNSLDSCPDPAWNARGMKAAEEGKGEESGVQESQTNTHFAAFACPQTCQARPVSDVQSTTTLHKMEKHSTCASGDGDVSSELAIRRTLPQREQPSRNTIRGQDVNAVENGEVEAYCKPLPGQAELQPQPEI